MKKVWRSFLIIIILTVLSNSFFPVKASITEKGFEQDTSIWQNYGTQKPIQLNSSNEGGVSFELKLPWQQIQSDLVTVNEAQFTQVSIPDWPSMAQPGEPALPYYSQQIGVPFGVELIIKVTPGKSHFLTLSHPVIPAVMQSVIDITQDLAISEINQPNLSSSIDALPAIYSSEDAYPGDLARLLDDAVLRHQRVANIAIFPVQYNPTASEITVYESLTVEVKYVGLPQYPTTRQIEETGIFETFFSQHLLNYDSARQWRQPGVLSPSPISVSEASIEPGLADYHAWSPPDPGWRIKVREYGFYKLTYHELLTAGLPVDDLDPRTFQMFNSGSEIAIDVSGEADGIFNSDDYLIFYGQAINNKYTLDNVYWLTFGQQTGLRLTTRNGTPDSGQIPLSYQATQRYEQNHWYISRASGDENLERFLWQSIYASSSLPKDWSYSIPLPAVSSGDAKLTISMFGNLSTFINPDHHVKIYLNNVLLEDIWWDGFAWKVPEIDLPDGLLVIGNNTIKIECPNDTGVGLDLVYVDWIKIEFHNSFMAADDFLSFNYNAPGDWNFLIDKFSSDQISIYDITNPASIVKIDGIATSPTANGYSAQFQDDIASPKEYWAGSDATQKSVLSIEADTASNLQATSNGADYIIITHKDFAQAADELRIYRSSPTFRAMLVDVQDIYDEFHYGITSAVAIHDFLDYSFRNWQTPAPSFVVLMGDGHYDPKNYLGYGRVSYIPPYLAPVDPWIIETASDNRYVTVSGSDTFPDMMIGRISVNSISEATAAVDKIIAYEQNPTSEDWQLQVLAVADNADNAGNFATLSDDLLDCCLPDPYSSSRVFLGVTHSTKDLARAAIQAEINAGKLIVNYIGHAASTAWASEGLLTYADIPLLQNGYKQPIVLAMTCYDGSFHSPNPYSNNKEALGELVTRVQAKGAIASWSPTGLGVATGHDYLNRGFFDAVFSQGVDTVGEATLAGKFNLWSTGFSPDLLDTYLLFGDPALMIANAYAAMNDTYQTNEDVTLNVPAPGVLDNDHANQPITAVWVSDPSNGSLSLNADGSFQYIPDTNFYGMDIFTYKIWDGVEYSNTATVTITVSAVNDAPVAVDDAFEVDQDSQLIVAASALTANDTDADNDELIVVDVSNPLNGTVNLDNDTITFIPTSGFSGIASIDYTVSDGLLSDTGHVVITVNALVPNQPPVVSDIPNQTIAEGSSFTTINLDNFVSDADNTVEEMTWTTSGNSQLSVGIVNRIATISVTNADWNGAETITFRATDPDGLYDEDAATFTVTAVNDPPVVNGIPNQTILEGSTFFATINLDNYVMDVDNTVLEMTWSFSGNTQLSVSILNRVATIGVPDANWNGAETITFRATDPGDLFDEEAAIFTVTAVNDPPVNTFPGTQSTLINQELVFAEASLISIDDLDVSETPGAMLQVSLIVDHGSLTLSQITGLLFTSGDGASDASLTFMGTIHDINAALDGMIYTPALGYTGNELLTIITNDLGYTGEGDALTDTDTVSIIISESYHLYIPLVVR